MDQTQLLNDIVTLQSGARKLASISAELQAKQPTPQQAAALQSLLGEVVSKLAASKLLSEDDSKTAAATLQDPMNLAGLTLQLLERMEKSEPKQASAPTALGRVAPTHMTTAPVVTSHRREIRC